MTFHHRRMQLFCMLSALLFVIALVGIQVVSTTTAHAATNQFHGVNWANPNDNFGTGNLVPVGLSTSDSYATTYTKATADPQGVPEPGGQHGAVAVQRGDHIGIVVGLATRQPGMRPRP